MDHVRHLHKPREIVKTPTHTHTRIHTYTHARIRRRYLYAISSLTSSPHPPIAFTRSPPFVPRREQRMFLPPSLMKIVHTYNGTKAGGKSGETRWNDGDNRGTMGSRYGIRSRFESPGITRLTKINEMVYSLCLSLSLFLDAARFFVSD